MPASADGPVCVPFTVDGVNVACVTVSGPTVVTQPNGDPQAVFEVSLSVNGSQLVDRQVAVTVPVSAVPVPCVVNGAWSYAYRDRYAHFSGQTYGVGFMSNGDCVGLYGVTFVTDDNPDYGPASVTTTTVDESIPYHVPQVCFTPTSTCVGPLDGTLSPSVPVPASVTPPSTYTGTGELCLGAFDQPAGSSDAYFDDSNCVDVPLAMVNQLSVLNILPLPL